MSQGGVLSIKPLDGTDVSVAHALFHLSKTLKIPCAVT